MMKGQKAFTLIEMLVVIGIIAVLVVAGMAAYSGAIRNAQRARGNELVHSMQVALVAALQKDDCWPASILKEGRGGNGKMTSEVGAALVRRNLISGSFRSREVDGDTVYEMTGFDKFGILSPWAADVVRQRISSSSLGEGTSIPSGGKLADHRLRFSVDGDYDGITDVNAEGVPAVRVRASACVWCCGYDGKFGTKDDIYSWTKEQEVQR